MSAYVCRSTICERRDRCLMARYPAPGNIHVIYFTPPEETHGNCPHYMELRDSGRSEVQP